MTHRLDSRRASGAVSTPTGHPAGHQPSGLDFQPASTSHQRAAHHQPASHQPPTGLRPPASPASRSAPPGCPPSEPPGRGRWFGFRRCPGFRLAPGIEHPPPDTGQPSEHQHQRAPEPRLPSEPPIRPRPLAARRPCDACPASRPDQLLVRLPKVSGVSGQTPRLSLIPKRV